MPTIRHVLPLLALLQALPATAAPPEEHVAYATEPGWLRVGPRSEYDAKGERRDEILGGTSREPLEKVLLTQGHASRDEALDAVVAELRDVQLRYPPPASGLPIPYLTATFRGRDYKLRLTPGFDEDAAVAMARTGKLARALEYDWEGEWSVLAARGVTPRQVFGGQQWLVHVVERSSVEGPIAEDRWMGCPHPPEPRGPGRWGVRLADGLGGTVGYTLDQVAGPFLDGWAMARWMRERRIAQVDLWPPVTSRAGRDAQPRVYADKVPDDPRNHGAEVLPAQPVEPNPALEDWVVTLEEGRWLKIGTRYELELPLAKRELPFGGRSDDPASREVVLPPDGERFTSWSQALRAVVADLSEIGIEYHPRARPRETVAAKWRGREVTLRFDRGPTPGRIASHRSVEYDVSQNVDALRVIDPAITPRRRFGEQWLVYATGRGDYYKGYIEVDQWMMIAVEPGAGGKFRVADGTGGTFTYDYSKSRGPFTDSYALIEALRAEKLDRIRLAGGSDEVVSASEVPDGLTPTDRGKAVGPPSITLVSISPASAFQGDELGVLIEGVDIDNAPVVDLGPGLHVARPTWFGRDPDSEHEQWVATARVAATAEPGLRTLTVFNTDGGRGVLPDAFEVEEQLPELCPAVEIPIPEGGADWIFAEHERTADPGDPVGSALRRNQLLDSLYDLEFQRSLYETGRAEQEQAAIALHRALKSGEGIDEAISGWRRSLEAVVRPAERAALIELSALAEALSFSEEHQLASSLRRRLECLAERAAGALDQVRAHNYTIEWPTYARHKRIYDVWVREAEHLAQAFQALNASRLLAAQRLLAEAKEALLRAGKRLESTAATTRLRPLQRRMRTVYLDQGETALRQAQLATERGLLEQDAYLAGVWAVSKEAEGIEASDEWLRGSAQGVIFGMKYLLAGAGSAMGAGIDSLTRAINATASVVTGEQVLSTVSGDVSKQLLKARQQHEVSLRGMNRLRGLTDEETAELTPRYLGDAALAQLEADRGFQEQTSGGVRRLAAVYELDPVRQMDRELGIAIAHAQRVARDIERGYNQRVHGNPEGRFEPFERLLTDPLGTARTLIQASSLGGDHFSAPHAFVAHRKAQLQELETVRDALRKVDFDPVRLARALPKTSRVYEALRRDHPDLLQWSVVRERLAAEARSREVFRALGREDDELDRSRLDRLLALNRHAVGQAAVREQARIFQLQGVERLMMWDYDGGLECLYQASELDPRGEIVSRSGIEALRKAIGWQKTVEAGMAVATQLGNAGIHTAMFEVIAGRIASRLPIKKAPDVPPPVLPQRWYFRSAPFAEFTKFVVGQVNPFAGLVNAAVVQREWAKAGAAVAGLAQVAFAQTVQVSVIQKAILAGAFGMDERWADLLANALISTGLAQTGSGRTLMSELARHLHGIVRRAVLGTVDPALHAARRDARRTTSDLYRYFAWADEYYQRRRALDDAAGPEQQAEMVAAAARLDTALTPVTKETLQRRYDDHFGEDAPAPGSPERLARIRDFLAGLRWKGGVKELNLDKTDPLSQKVDALRRELLANAQVMFVDDPRFASYRDEIETLLFIGSAGRRESTAYKHTGSDIDFTILVRADMPKARREQLRRDFMSFLQELSGGADMESLDMAVMVDPVPRFHPTGESVAGLLAAAADPIQRARLRRGMEDTIEQLVINASDGERYLDRGNLVRHNLFIRLGGTLKRLSRQVTGEGLELAEEPMSRYDEIYGDVPIEPWMAFDAVVGNLGYAIKHAAEEPKSDERYHKELSGKYAIRGPLYAALLGSPTARQRLATLTRAEIEARGWEGAERILVDIAREMLSRPGALRELDLPASVTIKGRPKPIVMGAERWSRLLEEWILLKEGASLPEVLGKPRGLSPARAKARQAELMAESVALSEAFYAAALRKSIMDQAIAIKQLEGGARDARARGDTAAAELLELKIKEIFLSQLAVWNRLGRKEQLLIMKQVPPEADWWVALEAFERLRAEGRAPDADSLRAWQPPSDPPAPRVVEDLRAQALQEEAESPYLTVFYGGAEYTARALPPTPPSAEVPPPGEASTAPGEPHGGSSLRAGSQVVPGGAVVPPGDDVAPPEGSGLRRGARDLLPPPP